MPKRTESEPSRELDSRDLKIINELRKNAWLSYVELAGRVNLSASAVQRRTERLIAERVIVGASAIISPEHESRPLRLYVLVELREEGRDVLRAFTRRIGQSPLVVEAQYVTGETDIVLTMQVTSMTEFVAFAHEYLGGDTNVRRFKTLTCMQKLK